MTALLPLSVSGVGGVGWLTLDPACTTINVSVPAAVATITMTQTSSVMDQYFAITPLPAVSMASVSVMLMQPPVVLGTATSATALALLSVHVGLVPSPTVFQGADITRYDLDAEGCVVSLAVGDALALGVKTNTELLSIRSLWACVAFPACRIE